VNALDKALRAALEQIYPELAALELTDYKVRILAGHAGTDSVTRVLVTSADATAEWTTVGVHANVVEASFQALLDSLVYALGADRSPVGADAGGAAAGRG
jgi:2-isopropylmalate synthase